MNETHIQLNQTPNCRTFVIENYAEREGDQLQHIEDTPLFWVTRYGRQVRRSWNELSLSERSAQLQAEQRAAEVVLNDPCYLEVQ